MSDKPPDIIARLLDAAASNQPVSRSLLIEAAEIIETLRDLVGIRRDIELEDAEPQGRA